MAAPRVERRLAAVLAADVVGYSHLMEIDEAGTVARLKCHRKELVEPLVAEHNGRVVKLMGDGALCEFPSAVAAVEVALAVQREMAGRETGLPEDQRIRFRIGINLGDLIVEGDDLYGDGVNIAARLEALAEPGGVVISGTVHDQVAGKVGTGFAELGELRLKNIGRPVRAYRVVSDRAVPVAPRDAPAGERPVVAVMPFTTMSDAADQEYFADGLTEDLITALSAWRRFPVIGRHSTFAYKGKSPTIAQVAKELDARYVVEGSVRRAGSRVRIAAQLIDAATGHHVWAQRYDRELTDIFAVQDEITERMVVAIEPELDRAERQRALRKAPDNLDAWDLALRAQSHVYQFTADDNREAFRLLEQAIRLDPGSAFALSLLALCHYKDAILGFSRDRVSSFSETYRAAERAVMLDGGDWLAHAMLGIARLWTRRDFDRALAEVTRAAELNPSSTIARLFVSCILEFGGRPADAIPGLNAAVRLDPFSPLLSFAYADLAISHLLVREPEQAVAAAEQAISINPDNVRARQRLTAALGHLGRTGEARDALASLLRRQPDLSLEYIDSTYPFRLAEDREFFLVGLRKAGWCG